MYDELNAWIDKYEIGCRELLGIISHLGFSHEEKLRVEGRMQALNDFRVSLENLKTDNEI